MKRVSILGCVATAAMLIVFHGAMVSSQAGAQQVPPQQAERWEYVDLHVSWIGTNSWMIVCAPLNLADQGDSREGDNPRLAMEAAFSKKTGRKGPVPSQVAQLGWEPFAITKDEDRSMQTTTYHFRRRAP